MACLLHSGGSDSRSLKPPRRFGLFRASAAGLRSRKAHGRLAGLHSGVRSPRRSRPAYSLLEVLVASAVGVLLMGALYMAISVQLRHAQLGRDVVEQSLLARALLARMDQDIRLNLGPPLPAGSGSSSAAASSSAASSSGVAASSAAGSAGMSATGPAGTAASNSAQSSPTAPAGGIGPVQFNLWVQGDRSWVMLYISRVPRELNPIPGGDNPDQQAGLSDLRRVSYWLAGSGDSPLGLARQEVAAVTSDQAMAEVPPGIPDEEELVIAPEVKSLTFSYWDGNAWQDTWDGTAAGPDGRTPVGPPLAIAITLGIAASGAEGSAEAEQPLKLYRHVVPILTANGVSQPATGGTSTP